MNIDCQALRRFLDESAEVQNLPAAYQAHVDVCAGCRREWQAQRELLAALQPGPVPPLSPDFASRVMARLPQTAPQPAWMDVETVLLIALLLAGVVTAWVSLPPSLKSLLTYQQIVSYFHPLTERLSRMASLVTGFTKSLLHSLTNLLLAQGWKLVFISLVTLLVTKIAILLENRLKRLLR